MKKIMKKLFKNAISVALSIFMFANFFVSVASAVEKSKNGYITVAATEAVTKAVVNNTPINGNLLKTEKQ